MLLAELTSDGPISLAGDNLAVGASDRAGFRISSHE